MAGIEQGVGFPIRAVDQYSGAFDKMIGKANQAGSVIGKLNSAIAGLGITLSVGALGAFAKQAIDALDRLNDLSKTTRISAEDLSGLGFAAKQSGGDLQSAADAVLKLSTNMGKTQERFNALGVSARDPIQALKQLADATNAIEDPQQRAAVLAEALGKSWQQVAPLLAEGSAKMGEMIEQGKKLSGVTEESVRLADELNDKLGLLVGNGGALNATIGATLPLLNKLADDLLRVRKESDGGASILSTAFAEALRAIVVLGGNVVFVLDAMGREIGGIAAQVVAFASGDFRRAAEIGRDMKATAEANRKAFDEWEASILAVGTATRSTAAAIDAGDQVSRRMATDAAARAREFLDFEERKRRAAKEAEEAARAAARAERERWEEAIKGLKRYFDALGELEEFEERTNKKVLGTIEDVIEGIADKVDDLAGAGMQTFNEAVQESARLWSEVGDVAGTFFSDLVMNGKSAFDNLRKWVKQLIADMIALFAKRWVLNVAASGGSTFGSAANAATGGAGSDSLTGAALNWAGGAIGASSVGTAFATGFTGGAAGLGGMELTGMAALGEYVGVAYGAVMDVLAMIPVWGWIAMAVLAIAAWFGGKGGGPKVGGSFFSGGAVPGTDNGRFYTPSQGDSQLREIVTATIASYGSIATHLGGKPGDFDFGLGFDHDPNGSARSRVSSLLAAGGRSIYGVTGREMDDKEVPAAIALETQRMIIAALQETDLADALDKLFDSIDVSTATAEQLNEVLARAMEMKQIIDVLAIWKVDGLTVEAIQAVQRGGETLSQTLQSVGAALQTFEQLFYTEAERHTLSLERMTRQFEALGVEMPTTREAFRALVESIDKSSPLWRALIELAPAFSDLFPIVEDLGDSAANTANKINDAVQLIDASLSQNLRPDSVLTQWLAGRQGRQGIGQFLDNAMTGASSPLSAEDRLAAAEAQFARLLEAANGGDVGALGRLTGVAQTIWGLSNDIWGSGGQTPEIFRRYFDALAGVAEVPDYQARMIELQAQQADNLASISATLLEIRDRLDANAEYSAAASFAGAQKVAGAVKNAGLKSKRR